jgi:hypothetical protein
MGRERARPLAHGSRYSEESATRGHESATYDLLCGGLPAAARRSRIVDWFHWPAAVDPVAIIPIGRGSPDRHEGGIILEQSGAVIAIEPDLVIPVP